MVGKQLRVSDIVVAAIAEEPYVGLTAFLQYSFEGQGYRATVSIINPRTDSSSILYHLANGTLATRDIPHAASNFVEQHGRILLGRLGDGFQ